MPVPPAADRVSLDELRWKAPTDWPLALAVAHRQLAPDQPVRIPISASVSADASSPAPASPSAAPSLATIVTHSGFDVTRESATTISAVRANALPDHVLPNLRVLVVGLNPSPYSVTSGVAYGRPGNRFWPAALASGLVSADRDPIGAARRDGVGFTDLVRRPTRRADELTADEHRTGHARLTALVEWLEPTVVCVVGLAGWRAAVDRRTVSGFQPQGVGGRPVYVMPSTSGLNASSSLDDLTYHLRTVAASTTESSTTE